LAAPAAPAATTALPTAHGRLEDLDEVGGVDQRSSQRGRARGPLLHDSLELEYLHNNKKKKKKALVVAAAARSIVDSNEEGEEEGGPLGVEDDNEDGAGCGDGGADYDDAMMDTVTTGGTAHDMDHHHQLHHHQHHYQRHREQQHREQIETNGPPTAGDREMAFHTLRSKMGHLEEVIEDIGQFICENQLEDHFINFVFRLSSVSKDLNTEISTVESYLEFIVPLAPRPLPCSPSALVLAIHGGPGLERFYYYFI
jgi:hypothetical protein